MQAPARYLVIIDSDGAQTAMLFTAARLRVAEFDAGTEEIAVMTTGLAPTRSATAPEWDKALAGSTPAARAAAEVYELDV
ncbi:hypothetical protein [Aquabacterium humicola]|uniref:hypothetical protein n=1 Tax=Aquabacterium humicola TaxID=3237377 RepID=UPI002542E7EF|nr:hypothetical protein [Rubrivivax pictus]